MGISKVLQERYALDYRRDSCGNHGRCGHHLGNLAGAVMDSDVIFYAFMFFAIMATPALLYVASSILRFRNTY
jgi:hypothetical protein